MTPSGQGGNAGGPFERAVERELEAIELHESAAQHLDEMAAHLERHAAHDRDELIRQEALGAAANARRRAQSARDSAAAVRDRLRQEGFEPDA